MTTLLFGLYGALCFLSLVAFLIWASVAKLRPDLDEETFDIHTLEQVSNSEEFGNSLPVRRPMIKHSPRLAPPPPPRPVKPSRRRQGRPYAIHKATPRRPRAA
jgi:hypothetical protein